MRERISARFGITRPKKVGGNGFKPFAATPLFVQVPFQPTRRKVPSTELRTFNLKTDTTWRHDGEWADTFQDAPFGLSAVERYADPAKKMAYAIRTYCVIVARLFLGKFRPRSLRTMLWPARNLSEAAIDGLSKMVTSVCCFTGVLSERPQAIISGRGWGICCKRLEGASITATSVNSSSCDEG